MTDSRSIAEINWLKDLLLPWGFGLFAMAIAVPLYVRGHWIFGSIATMVAAFFLLAVRENYRKSRFTPEEKLSYQTKLREASERQKVNTQGQKEDAERRKITKAENLRSQLRPPPLGATAPSTSAIFLRLSEKRMRGIRKAPVIELVCGSCAYGYLVSWGLVNEYRTVMSPGASLRRFNNPNAAFRQDQSQLNLRCPSCGSIDPGIWIDT
jgi:hypothetical protein